MLYVNLNDAKTARIGWVATESTSYRVSQKFYNILVILFEVLYY